MNISFTCPHCGTTTQVAERYAGLTGPCARCGKTVTMPSQEAFDAAAMRFPEVKQPAIEVNTRAGWLIWLPLIFMVVALLIVGIVIIMAIQQGARFIVPKPTMQQVECEGNLLRIAHALQAYNADYDCLPPAVVFDAAGQPAHSWRVLLLPYLGEDELHAEYDFDQPWNGPNNQKLNGRMPDVYGCPADPDMFRGLTNYVAVVGAETAWPENGLLRLRDVPPDQEANILLVEHADTSIPWLAPQDLRWDELAGEVNDHGGNMASAWHAEGAHVVRIDGQIEFLPAGTSADEVRQRLIITRPAAATQSPPPTTAAESPTASPDNSTDTSSETDEE